MAKRELLILAGFGLAGLVAYQLATPASRDETRPFSWDAMRDSWRRGSGRAGTATAVVEGTVPLDSPVAEVRVARARAVRIEGEDRSDIGYRVQVDATGADNVIARAVAEAVALRYDVAGDVVAVSVQIRPGRPLPPGGGHTAEVALRVPRRLAVRLDGAERARVSDVGALTLEGVSGDTRLERIAGRLTGVHRAGPLTIRGAGTVDMTLIGSIATLSETRGALALTARSGETHLLSPRGTVEIDMTNGKVSILDPADAVRVNASGGDLTIDRPHADVRVDARRTTVTITVDAAAAVTAFTSERALRVWVPPALAIGIDAATRGGVIRATDIGLEPQTDGADMRLLRDAAAAARLTLRNERGDIEIVARK